MDLATFLHDRRPSWKRLEELLERAESSGLACLNEDEAVELGNLYRRAASDLNQAQTFVSGDATVRYLNDLVARTYLLIYGKTKIDLRAMLLFLFWGWPAVFRRYLPHFLVALGLFVFGAVFGFLACTYDKDVARPLLLPTDMPTIQPREEGETYTLTTRIHDGPAQTFTVRADAAVVIDGKPGKTADIPPGRPIAIVQVDDLVTKIDVGGPNAAPPAKATTTTTSQVTQIEVKGETYTLTVRGPAATFTVGADVRVAVDGKPGKAADIQPDRAVTITQEDDRVTKIDVGGPDAPAPAKETATTTSQVTQIDANREGLQGAGEYGAFSSFLFTHNATVTLVAFALGVTLGIGTVWFMFENGLMIGVLGAVFWEAEVNHPGHGYFLTFITGIVPHGVLELPACFIGGAAGLLLAQGMIRARAWPRREEMARLGKEAFLLVSGAVPLLVVAGLLEAGVARAPDWFFPSWFKLSVACLFAALFLTYTLRLGWGKNPHYRRDAA